MKTAEAIRKTANASIAIAQHIPYSSHVSDSVTKLKEGTFKRNQWMKRNPSTSMEYLNDSSGEPEVNAFPCQRMRD